MLAEVNYLAVIGAAVATFILGMLWYSPLMFGNIWLKLMGFTSAQMKAGKKKGMGKTMAIAFISTLVWAYVLDQFLKIAGAVTVQDGLQVGFLIWLGFIATTLLGSILWEGKPVKLYLINVAHQLTAISIASIILVCWV